MLSVALLATGQGRFSSAAKIIAALERFRPDAPQIAEATAALYIGMGDFSGTVRFIDETGLKRFPNSGMLKVLKGMALMRLNRSTESTEILREATRADDAPEARNLAIKLLEI